jgi:hypothetical protein
MKQIPEEYRQHCDVCNVDFDVRDLNQTVAHLHSIELPEDFELPEHYTIRKFGENKEFLDGKEEVNLS